MQLPSSTALLGTAGGFTQVSTGLHPAAVPGQLVHSCGFCRDVLSELYCAYCLLVASESLGHVAYVFTCDMSVADQPTGHCGVAL